MFLQQLSEMDFDVFPSVVIDDIDNFKSIQIPDTLTKAEAIAFVAYLQPENVRIRYKPVEFNEKIDAHYIYCFNNIPSCSTVAKDPCWKRAESRMKRSNVPKKNTDVTLSFRTSNLFLVKTLFTFGLRKTDDKYHVFQTFTSPMIFYVPRETAAGVKERTFSQRKQDFYSFVLQPNSVYAIPPHTEYLIMTCYKSLFAVDVCTENVVRALEQQNCTLKNPLEQQPYNYSNFDRDYFFLKKPPPPPPPPDYLDVPPPSVMSLDSIKKWNKRTSDAITDPLVKKRKEQEKPQIHFYLVPEQSFTMDNLFLKPPENLLMPPPKPELPSPPPPENPSMPPPKLPSPPPPENPSMPPPKLPSPPENLSMPPPELSPSPPENLSMPPPELPSPPPPDELLMPPPSPPLKDPQPDLPDASNPLEPEILLTTDNIEDEISWVSDYIDNQVLRLKSRGERENDLSNLANFCTKLENSPVEDVVPAEAEITSQQPLNIDEMLDYWNLHFFSQEDVYSSYE